MQAELTWGFLLGEGKGERREIRKLRSASWKEREREWKRGKEREGCREEAESQEKREMGRREEEEEEKGVG